MTGSSGEKRRHPRYHAQLPVELGESRGVTRDVSTSGMFVFLDEPLAPGSSMTFTLVLPQAVAEGLVRLRGNGSVVRVEQEEGRLGIAVHFDSLAIMASKVP